MDASNIAHMFFSFLIPLGWMAILKPFSGILFRNWYRFFISILVLSIAAIITKEYFDSSPSINDIVSDALGFFLGTVLVSVNFSKQKKHIFENRQRDVLGKKISLRNTLLLINRIEARSADFYQKASMQISDPKAAGLCSLLAIDAKKRSNRIALTLSEWMIKPEPEELTAKIEQAFSSHQLFSLDFSSTKSPKEVIEAALDHEKKKVSLFSKIERAFYEEWKILHLKNALNEISREVKKLELCLNVLESEQAQPSDGREEK